jgi:hypothetical protein
MADPLLLGLIPRLQHLQCHHVLTWILQTGPTSTMAFTYVAASIQSVANLVGHIPGTDKACTRRGMISCVVKFGGREIDYLSYL